MSDYPEHVKLKAIQPLSQSVGEFLEWLAAEGMAICRYEESREFHGYMPVRTSRDQLLAEHFDINLNTLEAEKRQMLDEQRQSVG